MKKEDFEDGKQDEKLDKNDYPKLFTDSHAFESVVVKVKDPLEKWPAQ